MSAARLSYNLPPHVDPSRDDPSAVCSPSIPSSGPLRRGPPDRLHTVSSNRNQMMTVYAGGVSVLALMNKYLQ